MVILKTQHNQGFFLYSLMHPSAGDFKMSVYKLRLSNIFFVFHAPSPKISKFRATILLRGRQNFARTKFTKKKKIFQQCDLQPMPPRPSEPAGSACQRPKNKSWRTYNNASWTTSICRMFRMPALLPTLFTRVAKLQRRHLQWWTSSGTKGTRLRPRNGRGKLQRHFLLETRLTRTSAWSHMSFLHIPSKRCVNSNWN